MRRSLRALVWLPAVAAGCAGPPAKTARPPSSGALFGASPRGATTESAASAGVAVLRAPGPPRVPLPGGTFTMGSTEAQLQRAIELCSKEPINAECSEPDFIRVLRLELEPHLVTLSPFSIDRLEVSVEAYERCMAAGTCGPPAFARDDVRFARPELPVTHVRWADAVAYCAFVSGRLPTEAEWEYAARGSAGRTFPWGMSWASKRANHGSLASESRDGSDGYVGLAPVDALPDGATPTGILNLAGNVSEWVADVMDLTGREVGYDKAPVRNPRGSETGEHLHRGGSYRTPASFLRSASRLPYSRPFGDDVGFRCAYDE